MTPFLTAVLGVSWRTTVMGYVLAILVAVMDYLATGADFKSPIFWTGLLTAVSLAIKGRLTKDAGVSNSPHPLPTAQEVPPK